MNLNQAMECAKLSQSIYNPMNEFYTQLSKAYPGCPIQVIQKDGCECACIALPEKKTTLLVFRGTEFSTPNDFLANIDAVRDQDPLLGKVYVHSGFLGELKSVWQQVYQFVDVHARAGFHHIITTGHSLGGALALLCATRLSRFTVTKTSCYSFGAPMVGGDTFRRAFDYTHNLDHFRFVNNNDIVPKLKTLNFLGYEHVGQRFYFNYLGDIISRELTWQERWKDWLWGHWQAVKRIQLFDSLKDHRMKQYVKIIEQNLS